MDKLDVFTVSDFGWKTTTTSQKQHCITSAAVLGSGAVVKRVLTDPLHVEGERLPASGFGLVPAQHNVGVTNFAGVDVCGRQGNFDITCGARGERKKSRPMGHIGIKSTDFSFHTLKRHTAQQLRFFSPAATILTNGPRMRLLK